MKHAGRLTAFVAATLVAVAVAAPAGRPTPAIQGAPQEAGRQQPAFRTAANYVRVDAYPTANGQIVPDLTQADFEILEDGVPQKIDAFERDQ